MALKKPSDFFGESKKESIIENLVKKPELTSFSDAVNSYKENISKFEDLSETLKSIESIQSDIKNFIKKEDLDNAVGSYAFLLEETVAKLKNDVTGINEKNLISMRSNISNLTEKINNFFKIEVPKYKKNIVEIEIKSSDKFEKYKNDTDVILEDISKYVSDKYESIDGINKDTILEIEKSISKHQIDIEQRTEKNISSVNETVDRVVEDLEKKINLISDNKDTIFQDLSKKITEVKNLKKSVNKDLKVYEDHKNNVENKISDLEIEVIRSKSNLKNQNEEFIKVKKDIGNDFNTIHEEFKTVVNRLNLDELEEKNIQLSKKVKYLEEIFDKFNEKEFLNEGLVNITPETDNSDPLTPLDKNYVTLNQLQDHYRLFLNRIQQQLSTLGGGGETRLQYLDDIVGVATNLSDYNGKFLKVDTSQPAGKNFVFATTAGGGYVLPTAAAGTLGGIKIGSGLSIDGDGIVTASGGGGGSSDVVDDTTPQLGGNLDINGKYITGTGGVNVTGVVTSTKSHVGLDTGFFNEDLVVTGDARVTGILTIGTGSITLDPNAKTITGVDEIEIGTGDDRIKLKKSSRGTLDFVDRNNKSIGGIGTEARINTTGVITATTFSGALSGTATNATNLENRAASYYLNYDNFSNTPTIPTNNNQLSNGAGFITTSFTNTNQLTNGAGFITTSFTNTNQLTNGAGFITAAGTLTNGTQTNITSIGTLTSLEVNGDVSIGGTLTYEDVNNIDSVGLVTARRGIVVGSGYGIHVASGVITATTFDGNLATTNLTGTITNAQLAGSISNDKLAGSITNAKLAGSITNAKLSNSTVSYGGIEVALGSADATPAFDLSDATNYPTSSLTGTITNAQLAGSIAASKLAGSIGNAKLSNSTVSYGGIEVALGSADATPAFNLTDATNYPTSSLTGTITNAQLAGSISNDKLAGSISNDKLAGSISNDKLAGSISNNKLANSTVSYGGIEIALGASDATPAFNLQDATNYPYTSLTGITTDIIGDTTPQLGGNLDGNSKSIFGVGVLTATTFDGNLATSNLTGTITNTQLAGSISNDKLAGSISNNKLANSTVSYGGVSLALGSSDASPAFDLSDATNYPTSSLSGTITNAQLAGSIVDGKLASTFLKNVLEDTTPQLGGALDVQAEEINTSTTNGNIILAPNGTGLLEVKGNTNAGTIQLNCENNSHGVKIKGPPHSAGASYTLTLPNDDGSANDVLESDGNGNLSWTAKVTNATHTGDVTGATVLTIADDKIEEKHINAGGTPGADKVLVYDSSESTNWKWATQSGGGGGGSQNLFQTIAVSGQNNVVADSTTDTLTLVAGTNVTITTDDSADSVTIAASGGGGGSTDMLEVMLFA